MDLIRALTNGGIVDQIAQFQTGTRLKDWVCARGAAICGHLELLKPEYGFELFPELIMIALEHGHLDVARYLHARGVAIPRTGVPESIFAYGRLDILQWLHSHSVELVVKDVTGSLDGVNEAATYGDLDAITTAAVYGNLEIVQWLHDMSYTTSQTAMNYAAFNGHLDVVRFLHENRSEGCTTMAMDEAAHNGYLEVVRFLHEHGKSCTTVAMDWAARKGHLDVVRFLHENRSEGCTYDAMIWAAECGHLDVVRFLNGVLDMPSGGTIRAITVAAENGHLEIVRWLYENGCRASLRQAIERAETAGYAEIAEWLRAVQRG